MTGRGRCRSLGLRAHRPALPAGPAVRSGAGLDGSDRAFEDVLVGGGGVIPLWWDMAALTALSLLVFVGAMVQGRRRA